MHARQRRTGVAERSRHSLPVGGSYQMHGAAFKTRHGRCRVNRFEGRVFDAATRRDRVCLDLAHEQWCLSYLEVTGGQQVARPPPNKSGLHGLWESPENARKRRNNLFQKNRRDIFPPCAGLRPTLQHLPC